ncbi:small integral membrane protein 20 isoform X1 [Perognathus longimembris pacificus]|uniref:small integral membrane protein 20 isoform X1 n=1 Tax=Perognathus longimembris pacificus TaxID=214514 RepID=UPI0020184D1E|nr:small integral membrane protein 20 isoform X1 [Perognathus longimembris pacificus]
MSVSRNLRTVLIFGGFVSLVGAAFYPIYFRPLMRVEEYQLDIKSPIISMFYLPKQKEGTIDKSGWDYSRKCAATRVESVV